jgi:hypothetical protein
VPCLNSVRIFNSKLKINLFIKALKCTTKRREFNDARACNVKTVDAVQDLRQGQKGSSTVACLSSVCLFVIVEMECKIVTDYTFQGFLTNCVFDFEIFLPGRIHMLCMLLMTATESTRIYYISVPCACYMFRCVSHHFPGELKTLLNSKPFAN